ncbi:PREDICTED: beta-glucosidase 1-like [Ipomoea nil]|uniref:beta-glucosidase 1-like n=1 Tax=Ipomoea nil TaxID=35883 RepID=UPI000901056E|nr:PREDICTED: beta-glucosidase 1-like [Ipomoea nil]XP_019154234.1 PREDICTED: beta-glucosidase 1-like [Ipomoea nil]XP_019154235.1 PREDICTED: beta-glucosidase 1-like [Ipomoea nil]
MARSAPLLLLLLVLSTVSSLVQCNTSVLSRKSFPAGFVFGTATSAYQVEGATDIHKYGRGPSIWDTFIKTPGLEPNNATGDVAVDQYHHYKKDIDLLVKLNFDAYRFSISWTRIFPNGTGKVNWKGVDYYNRLINYMLKKGITPYACLNHYDLPQALQDRYGGWLGRQVTEDFADYAEFCFKTFGDRVKNWFSFNEPRVVAALGYDTGFFAPGRCSNCTEGNSATEPYTVAHNLILCHAAAAQRYHTKYQAKQNGSFGILLDFVWYEPLTMADEHAAQRARDFHIGWFLHPIVYGEYPKTMQKIVGDRLPKFTHDEVKMVKGSFDYVGINQYTTYYVYDPSPNTSSTIDYQNDWNAVFAYDRNGVPIGPRANSDWLYMVPWGLYKAVTYVKEQYGNPRMFISENGMDYDGNLTLAESFNDTKRISYYKSYIGEVKRAVDHGANLFGYFAWSLVDNFEWRLGYTSRFGIVYIDFNTLKRMRYPKKSAYWFQHFLRRNKY